MLLCCDFIILFAHTVVPCACLLPDYHDFFAYLCVQVDSNRLSACIPSPGAAHFIKYTRPVVFSQKMVLTKSFMPKALIRCWQLAHWRKIMHAMFMPNVLMRLTDDNQYNCVSYTVASILQKICTVYTHFGTPVPCEKGHTWPKTN